jgi:hypothetical protein
MSAKLETHKHIHTVAAYIHKFVAGMLKRADRHDASKLEDPEAPIFEEFTAKLKGCTYGSDEYKGFLVAMKPALDHHYSVSPHHPEFHKDGIKGMSLLDIAEMLLDWKAASLRHADGSVLKSIEINQKRFGYSDELKAILLNTVKEMGL